MFRRLLSRGSAVRILSIFYSPCLNQSNDKTSRQIPLSKHLNSSVRSVSFILSRRPKATPASSRPFSETKHWPQSRGAVEAEKIPVFDYAFSACFAFEALPLTFLNVALKSFSRIRFVQNRPPCKAAPQEVFGQKIKGISIIFFIFFLRQRRPFSSRSPRSKARRQHV